MKGGNKACQPDIGSKYESEAEEGGNAGVAGTSTAQPRSTRDGDGNKGFLMADLG